LLRTLLSQNLVWVDPTEDAVDEDVVEMGVWGTDIACDGDPFEDGDAFSLIVPGRLKDDGTKPVLCC